MNKAERRRRRKIKRIITTVACVILAVLITLFVIRIRILSAFHGDYVRPLDITDKVVASAALWLDDVEGADITEDWVREHTEGILVNVNLNFDPSGPLSGTYTEEIDAAGFAACREQSKALVCDCLRELIIKRLELVGYGENISDQDADALIGEALGMNLDNYLESIGLDVMPDFDMLEEDIARSGEFKIRGSSIIWNRDGVECRDRYSTGKNILIINEPALVYTREKKSDKQEDDKPGEDNPQDNTAGFLSPLTVYAATMRPENVNVSVDGGAPGSVRAINASYDNNIYISLRDTALLFAGSSRPFNLDITGGSVAIMTGEAYSDEFEHSGYSEEELKQYPGNDPSNSSILVDGEERKYFSILKEMGDYYDCFLSPMDLAMILDVNVDLSDEEPIRINTNENFDINPARMEEYGYFDGFNTVVVGDATTGDVFYGYNYEEAYPIASTTKLMTYLLTMDAVSSGAISLDDPVTISSEAAALSGSQDGSVALEAGWQVPVNELILGALLPSSNECALALAEYVGGSSEKFVNMMNEKAKELGLNSASFNNSNGLPEYTDTVIPAKIQNMMSGYDMFRMCAHILNTYPQVKEITSLKTAGMPTLNRDLKNTNGLLYNMSEVNGLKTGTTDKSGACLITSLTVNVNGTDHDLVVVELGAENSQARLRGSELMARYGKNVLLGKAPRISYSVSTNIEEDAGKVTAEEIVRKVVDFALKK